VKDSEGAWDRPGGSGKDRKTRKREWEEIMKKVLVLGLVLALVAILVVPVAAAFADSGTTQVDGAVVETSVSVTPPGTCDFGNFAEGANGHATGSTQGSVIFTQGTGVFDHWQLAVYTTNDANGDFSAGEMYCTALARYLDTPMQISLDNITYYPLPGGLTYNGDSSASYDYWIYATQDITHDDAIAGAGAYYIVIISEVTLVL
jgi:hypothetical protein